MLTIRFISAGFGFLSLALFTATQASANPFFRSNNQGSPLTRASFKGTEPVRYVPFTMRDVLNGAPSTGTGIVLDDGRVVEPSQYLRELNAVERELAGYGSTLRSTESNLGTVARANYAQPRLTSSVPANQQSSSTDSDWSHEINHELASVKSSGQVIQTQGENTDGFERITTHKVAGRFLDAQSPAIAQFIQRIVKDESGEEFRETMVYINGRQVFRRGRSDAQEARIWKTAFDVPLKNITVPVGPGSIDAKLGIRGGVNLDLDMTPSKGTGIAPQISLDFKPQVIADGYVSAMTTPTNIGEAGFEGAITLADNTLKILGTATLSLSKFVDLKQATVDNIFAGFSGKIVGYANVKMPSKKADDSGKKKFEKEFYKWDGIRIEQRLYEYKAPEPQPPAL